MARLRRTSKKIERLGLAHVNYGLRGEEADADERFCRQLAAGAGAEFHGRRVGRRERAARRGESVQEWARRLRRELFQELAADGWLIALGHHADDAAENVLLRLARGTSSGAMLGMSELDPPFWRPLLSYRKAELGQWLADFGLTARYDASNDKMDYGRNVVRQLILPALAQLHGGAGAHLVACAQDGADLAHWCQTVLRGELAGRREAACSWLANLPTGVFRLAVATLIADARGDSDGLSRRTLDAARRLVGQGRGRIALAGGGVLIVQQGRLRYEAGDEPHHDVVCQAKARQDEGCRPLLVKGSVAKLARGKGLRKHRAEM